MDMDTELHKQNDENTIPNLVKVSITGMSFDQLEFYIDLISHLVDRAMYFYASEFQAVMVGFISSADKVGDMLIEYLSKNMHRVQPRNAGTIRKAKLLSKLNILLLEHSSSYSAKLKLLGIKI
jgi:hypothetical protein